MASVAQNAGRASTPYLGRRNQVAASYFRGAPFSSNQFDIGYGDKAIRATIGHMERLVHGAEGVINPTVRGIALEILRNAGAVKNVSEIDAIFQWVKKNIEFRGEHDETVQSPLVTLQFRAGDCDDHAILSAALLKAIGYQVRFKTIATQASSPQDFSHVYVEVLDKQRKQWVPLDTTVAVAHPGWEPPVYYRQQTHPMRGRRRLRGMGDDYSFQPIPPLVPGVAAPAGLSPGAQAAFDLIQPFAQAGASYLAHGQTANPNFNAGFNFAGTSAGIPSAIPAWMWIAGFGLIAFLIVKKR